jgi:glycosyltransferase involved in cell wall biosynthesis
MAKKNILILTPSLNNSGGVANYYSILQNKFPFDYAFFIVGNREEATHKDTKTHHIVRLISDYCAFIRALWRNNLDLVLINPSLNFNGFSRDYIFYLIAKLLKKKTIVFFRGWDDNYAKVVFTGKFRYFFRPLRNTDGFIVLAKCFRDTLSSRLKISRVFVESTIFDERILPQGYDALCNLKNPNGKIRMLFLSRIETDKGIYESIEAYKALRAKDVNVELVIAGDGSEASNIQRMIAAHADEDLRYLGRISGAKKADALLSSSILLFPSMHAEGMPNTVLEAMGCGLAVLTTRVGGISDFFVGDLMGAELAGDLTQGIVGAVSALASDNARLKSISEYNYSFAKQYFHSERVVERLDHIIDSVIYNSDCGSLWYES